MEDREIQEIEKKKRSLKRYKKNLACIVRLEEKLYLLDERIKSVKSPSYSGMPRGGTPVTTDELIADKMELEERIERLQKKKRLLKNEILEEIDSLDDPRYCEILEAFFIDGLTLEEIAENEGITRQGVRDAIKRAEAQLFDFEKHLGLYERFMQINNGLDEIRELASLIDEVNRKTVLSREINDATARISALTQMLR